MHTCKITYFGVLIIVFFLCTFSVYAQQDDTSHITKMITRLGDVDNSVNFKILDSLKKVLDKYWLAGKLIAELDTLDNWAYEDGKNALGFYKFNALHVIWCWRALRMITSLDFEGATKREKSVAYHDSLYDKLSGKVKFAYVWPVKSVVYVAPGDAQLEIINQWRAWYRSEAKKYIFKTMDFKSTTDF
jgi:hypothetical protein